MSNYKVTVLGAGLAGCEAALWLAGKGVQVELYEQKPTHFSPAHKSEGFAELICSNSLKAERLDSASGLLKEEMRRMGSQLLEAAWGYAFIGESRTVDVHINRLRRKLGLENDIQTVYKVGYRLNRAC